MTLDHPASAGAEGTARLYALYAADAAEFFPAALLALTTSRKITRHRAEYVPNSHRCRSG